MSINSRRKNWQKSKVDTPLEFILSEKRVAKKADIDDKPVGKKLVDNL